MGKSKMEAPKKAHVEKVKNAVAVSMPDGEKLCTNDTCGMKDECARFQTPVEPEAGACVEGEKYVRYESRKRKCDHFVSM